MIPYKTIILDFDGPLLDGIQRHYQCYCDILTGRGYRPLPRAQYWALKRNRVDRRELLSLSGASDFYEEFLSEWLVRIEAERYLALDRLQPGVAEILAEWKSRDVRLILATMRNNPAGVRWQLDRFGISPFLDDVLTTGSTDGSIGKAAMVESILGASRADTMWIGDTEVDLEAARRIGVKVCLLTCGLRARDYLLSLRPDAIQEDLKEFAFSHK